MAQTSNRPQSLRPIDSVANRTLPIQGQGLAVSTPYEKLLELAKDARDADTHNEVRAR